MTIPILRVSKTLRPETKFCTESTICQKCQVAIRWEEVTKQKSGCKENRRFCVENQELFFGTLLLAS